ncbi:MAG: spore germination protein, partial [Neobacillus sp.]|nr:spore germination protein [Neobacillus sp.]
EQLYVGERNKTEIRLLYIKGLTDETNVQTLRQRIKDLEIDDVVDSNVLSQLLDDQSLSLFPQMLQTELPDRVSYMLLKGKVAILVDRSPYALLGPANFLNFFESTDDIYSRWNLGMFLRWLRFISIILATLLTPLYVATVTYHYQVVPVPLLLSIGQSRSNVPFPPVMEALILEFILELLKEAGARLPTKVGQTMGIVGGIVIGQAAVEAGFTSNILIILVALSALGTFTSPSYIMGTAFRFVRYPLIIFAGAWGGIGLMFGLIILILHLLKLTSMGAPYFVPVFPLRLQDLKDSVFRFPFSYSTKRPLSNRPQDSNRFPEEKAKVKKDIDE